MGEKANRNQPCPCGSGKKYKNCCSGKGLRFAKKDRSKMIIWIIAGIGIIIAGVVISNKFLSSSSQPAPIITQPFNSQSSSQQSGSVPQPGPAPEGKVWVPEHGHWHDAPGTAQGTATATALDVQPVQSPTQVTPQPFGPAPEGKVWVPEHGHWHDAPGTATVTTPSSVLDIQSAQSPAQLTPQPPGPAPEGKVWVPEHGHWHDAQQTPTIKVVDPKSTPSDP